jgi:hypothetical protein
MWGNKMGSYRELIGVKIESFKFDEAGLNIYGRKKHSKLWPFHTRSVIFRLTAEGYPTAWIKNVETEEMTYPVNGNYNSLYCSDYYNECVKFFRLIISTNHGVCTIDYRSNVDEYRDIFITKIDAKN